MNKEEITNIVRTTIYLLQQQLEYNEIIDENEIISDIIEQLELRD